MIGVQKRKSTCSAPSASVTSEPMTAAAASSAGMSEVTTIQQQQPASKSSRKRTKLTNRSHSASLASQQQQQPSSTLAAAAAAATSRSSSKQVKDQYGQIISNGQQSGGGNATDESVWIFGLINNIEQLLSTFTAINTNSTKSCNNSGTSTPTSLSSSFSFSSSNSSSSSLTPSRSTSASSSATSSPSSASSLASSPSSTSVATTSYSPSGSQHHHHHQQQQQAATSHTTLSTLPRSPISRQIKFHEYKGPPSAKRQQQTAKPPQQPSSAAVAPQQQQQIDSKRGKSPPMATACFNRVPLATASVANNTKQQSNNNNNNNNNCRPNIVGEKQQAHEPLSPAPQTALGAYGQTTANAAPPPLAAQQQLKSHHNLCRQDFVQAMDEQQTEVLAYHQQQLEPVVAHSVPIRQPQRQPLPQQPQAQRRRQVASSAQDQLTSGQPQCAHLQTFYINQQNTLENLAHGSTLVLAPFIEGTNTRQTALASAMQLDHLPPPRQQQQTHHQHHHQQQHQQPIQQLIQVQSAGCREQQPTPLTPSSIGPTSCGSLSATFGPSARFLESGQTQTLPPANVEEQQQHLSDSKQYQSTSGIKLENLAADFVCGQQQSLQDFSNYLQPFNHNHQLQMQTHSQPQQHHDFCSPQEFTSLSDDLATFGPDSEDTDACEIEPSISFSHGAEELLFSEFIDLQDVPMNVDESDWLKKFLPPCSMG